MGNSHYYGDTVRSLMMAGGVVMIVTMPFFTDLLPKPIFFSILAVLVIVLLSGMVNPLQKSMILASLLVSAGAFLAFEYYAVIAFQTHGFWNSFFLVNEALAVIFLASTYFATKSTRSFKTN